MSEYDDQAALVEWFRLQHAKYARCLRVSQSGNFRGKGPAGAIRSRRARAQGAVKDEADIAILLPKGGYGCLLVELKRGEGRSTVTEGQMEYLGFHRSIGNLAEVAIGVDHAIKIIDDYMALPTT